MIRKRGTRYRGHETEHVGYAWVYKDTQQPVLDNVARPCGKCSSSPTREGHDGCLGTLPGVTNACCGHGVKRPYVQMADGSCVYGDAAQRLIDVLIAIRPEVKK